MKKIPLRSRRATLGMLMLFVFACHDAPRNNPMDPELTPGVELLSVNTDPQAGTATVTWSAYAGDQPFQAYRIDRRLSGQVDSETRGTVTDQHAVRFVDTGVEADQTYVYTVLVINTAGLVVASVNNAEAIFPFTPSLIQSLVFDPQTATATLSWAPAISGFVHYEIQRQAEGESGFQVLYRTTDIDDTVLIDKGLNGNTTYTYTVTTRSSTARELESAPAGGKFLPLLQEAFWSVPISGDLTGSAVDPSGRVYIGLSKGYNPFDPVPALAEPDQIYQFSIQGDLLGQFAPEPSPAPPFFQSADLVADAHGVYVLLKKPTNPFGSLPPLPPLPPAPPATRLAQQQPGSIESYVNALDASGNLRFRWPPGGNVINLSAIAISEDGTLWIAENGVDPASGQNRATFHLVDPVTGQTVDTFHIDGLEPFSFFSGALSLGNGIGVIRAFAEAQEFAVFDLTSREKLPIDFAGEVSGSANDIQDIMLAPDNRLFILYDDPPRIDILPNWRFLTKLDLKNSEGIAIGFPARIEFDAGGNLFFLQTISRSSAIRVRIFGP